jgi:hypothetical protein
VHLARRGPPRTVLRATEAATPVWNHEKHEKHERSKRTKLVIPAGAAPAAESRDPAAQISMTAELRRGLSCWVPDNRYAVSGMTSFFVFVLFVFFVVEPRGL